MPIFSALFFCFKPTTSDPNCIFCGVKETSRTRILYQDDKFIAFEDLRPAAKHHFLVTPKAHVESVRTLTKENVPFREATSGSSCRKTALIKYDTVKDMEKVGNALMDKYDVPEEERRMGFHIPPFNSVNHLHLHVHGLPYKSSITAKKYPIVNGSGLYHKGLVWFVEVGQAIRILESGRRVGILPC